MKIEHKINQAAPESNVQPPGMSGNIVFQRRFADIASHYELSDAEFEQQFSEGSFPPASFTHEAHLRLAWLHVMKYGADAAIRNITGQIKEYVRALGVAHKYNETVTVAAIKKVHYFYLRYDKTDDFKSFLAVNSELITNFKALLQSHYSFDIFTSEEAKRFYIEPDLLLFD